MDLIQPALVLLTAVGACAAAAFTLVAALATKKASRGATLLSCLERYSAVMSDRNLAIEQKSPSLVEQFYRELLDLQWSEFHLWQEGVIPDHVMQAWLYSKKRNYDSDSIELQPGNDPITYRSVWEHLLRIGYFEMSDPFVRFMQTAHGVPVKDMKKLKKETQITR